MPCSWLMVSLNQGISEELEWLLFLGSQRLRRGTDAKIIRDLVQLPKRGRTKLAIEIDGLGTFACCNRTRGRFDSIVKVYHVHPTVLHTVTDTCLKSESFEVYELVTGLYNDLRWLADVPSQCFYPPRQV
ncbi:hypothetical protein RB195_010213 [Necator americanus]|uniref:Uncharacterized protein n=1 Tax=Necator americanus TaxID=51031 RepID=A0ABR1CYS0_NECAM